MQAFSGMQRSFTYKDALSHLLLVGAYVVYISLSSLYLLFPPLLALLFFAYYRALSSHDLGALTAVAVMLLMFEAEKGFWFGSTILFFTVIIHYLVPKIRQVVRCRICMAAIFTAFAYPGYWLFMWIGNQVLMLSVPAADWHMALYIVIEFLILAALV